MTAPLAWACGGAPRPSVPSPTRLYIYAVHGWRPSPPPSSSQTGAPWAPSRWRRAADKGGGGHRPACGVRTGAASAHHHTLGRGRRILPRSPPDRQPRPVAAVGKHVAATLVARQPPLPCAPGQRGGVGAVGRRATGGRRPRGCPRPRGWCPLPPPLAPTQPPHVHSRRRRLQRGRRVEVSDDGSLRAAV